MAIPRPDTSTPVIPTFSTSTAPSPLPPYLGFTKKQALCLRVGAFTVAAATVAGLPFVIALALTLGLLGLHYYAPNGRERRKRQAEVTALEISVQSKQEEWSGLANNFQLQFLTKFEVFEGSKNRYESLSDSRKQELERLEQTRRTEQRKNFLERHFIKDYEIDGIGRGRRATLLSYGIETFDDVTQRAVDQVPGFGPALTSALVALRMRIEAQFRFDPTKGVNPAAVAAIDQKYALQRVPLEKLLLGGVQELAPIHRAAKQQRTRLKDGATELTKALAQAKANAAVTENDQWRVIVSVLLVFGFVFRFALGGMQEPEPVHTTKQVVESPTRGESAQDVPPVLESHQRAKPAANKNPQAEAELARLRARFIQKNKESSAEEERIEEEKKRLNEEYEAQGTVSPGTDFSR